MLSTHIGRRLLKPRLYFEWFHDVKQTLFQSRHDSHSEEEPIMRGPGSIVRENVRNTAKKRKKSRRFGFWKKNVKNVKNVEV